LSTSIFGQTHSLGIFILFLQKAGFLQKAFLVAIEKTKQTNKQTKKTLD